MCTISAARSPITCTPRSFSVSVLKQFQKALVIAEHLSLGQLRVSCQTYFVRYLFPRQLFFRLPYHRDFGDGVNAVRNEIRRHLSGMAKHGTTGETPLFHRG